MERTPKKSFDTPSNRLTKSTGSKSCSPINEDPTGGRFIPNRVASNLKHIFEKACEDNSRETPNDDHSNAFSTLLQSQLFGFDLTNFSYQDSANRNILRYSQQAPQAWDNKENLPLAPLFQERETILQPQRKVPKEPYKVLDAPQLQDDFYLNLLDWSNRDVLAVGLGSCVYLWSAASSSVSMLCELPDDLVTSVSWANTGSHLAVGTSNGEVMLYDIEQGRNIRSFTGHTERVGALAWNDWQLSSGSRDRTILHRDPRAGVNFSGRLTGHKQEVCGLKWSFDGMHLASGGNDNQLIIWSNETVNSIAKFTQHTAAVKAIAWSPHQSGLLASGGGTADRTIRFWSSHTCEMLSSIDTLSQVCNLAFAKNCNELVSTHGYSQNQIILWKYPSMQKVSVLLGHTSRVHYLAMSPDGQNIVTGAGDETLRFWKVFPKPEITEPGHNSVLLSLTDLR